MNEEVEGKQCAREGSRKGKTMKVKRVERHAMRGKKRGKNEVKVGRERRCGEWWMKYIGRKRRGRAEDWTIKKA